MEQTWKPTVAGIMNIVSAVFVISQSFVAALGWELIEGRIMFFVILIVGIVALMGGIYALRRKIWGLALAGSICATISLFTWYLGILAIIFMVLSKKEFE